MHREHVVPARRVSHVRQKYLSMIEDDVFPTLDDMNEWIETVSGGPGVPVVFSFEISEAVADASLEAESLQQFTKDIKPTEGGNVDGVMISKSEVCVVCRCRGRFKIQCGHVFHRKCIRECTRWKNECPVCQAPLITHVVI